jgi:hypothetical protein
MFLLARRKEKVAHLLPPQTVANDDEVPRLHVANRGRVVGGHQQARQDGVIEPVGQEMAADVAAREDRAIDGVAGGLVERFAAAGGRVFGHRLSPCDRNRPA